MIFSFKYTLIELHLKTQNTMKKLWMAACGLLLLGACDRSHNKTGGTPAADSTDKPGKARTVAIESCERGTFDSLEVYKASMGTDQSKIYRSLNGYERDTALQMIQEYQKNPSNKPWQLAYFFRKQMVEEMLKMLCEEKADGVRIYFAARKGGGNGSKTTLILMPTKYCGKSKRIPEMDHHNDYFDHKGGTSYFVNLDESTLGGDKETTRAGGLYTLFSGSETPCPNRTNNSITQREASEMVNRWDNPRQLNTTKAAWYPLSVFKDVLGSPKCTGMRIYFGRHKIDPAQRYLSGRNTFIVVATKFDRETQTNINNYDCSSLATNSKVRLSETFLGEPQDMGELCPDNCSICDPNDPTTDCSTNGLKKYSTGRSVKNTKEVQPNK
jgi:hypothetical protein